MTDTGLPIPGLPVPSGPTVRVEPVPRHGYSTAWWGMATVIATESMIFIGLLATYFFLRATSSEWPIGGLELPELKITSIFSVVLIGSSIPVIFGERAIERNRVGALKVALAVAWLMGAAFLYRTIVDFRSLHFGWRDNAYGSIYYTTIGLHALHVLVGLAISAVVQIKVWLGRIDGEHHISVDVFALYWHFVDVVWIFVFTSLVVSPHLGR
jgi:heme/copper-type cytochrome/quinol oxidase subunit 3